MALGTPGIDLKSHLKILKFSFFLKKNIFQKLIYFIIWARFRHIWTPDSNSALKIIHTYRFKPGFGHFSIKYNFLDPQGPCDHEFLTPLIFGKGPMEPILSDGAQGPMGPMGPMGSMRTSGAHEPLGEF